MLVKFGLNPVDPDTGIGHDDAPGMSVTSLKDDTPYVVGTDGNDVRDHFFVHQGAVSHLPGNDAVIEVYQSIRGNIADGTSPSWVAVEPQERDADEASDFERCLSELYRCDRGEPADVEDTHYTLRGATVYPPGQSPGA